MQNMEKRNRIFWFEKQNSNHIILHIGKQGVSHVQNNIYETDNSFNWVTMVSNGKLTKLVVQYRPLLDSAGKDPPQEISKTKQNTFPSLVWEDLPLAVSMPWCWFYRSQSWTPGNNLSKSLTGLRLAPQKGVLYGAAGPGQTLVLNRLDACVKLISKHLCLCHDGCCSLPQ